jgi:hypothetical protein
MKELDILGQARDRLKGPEYLQAMRKAFGVQGSEGMAVLTEPQVIQQLPQLREWMTQMPGGETFFKDMFGESPEQQGKSTLAEFNRSLMDVGSTALPAATDALKAFNATLKGLNATLEKAGVPDASKATSWGLVGGGALAFSPWLRRMVGKLFSNFGEAATADGAGSLGPGALMIANNMQPDIIRRGSDGHLIMPEAAREHAWLMDHLVNPIERFFGFGSSQPGASAISDAQADRIGDRIAAGLNGAKVQMDGRQVGSLLMNRAGDELTKPPSGPSLFDPTNSPLYPATR